MSSADERSRMTAAQTCQAAYSRSPADTANTTDRPAGASARAVSAPRWSVSAEEKPRRTSSSAKNPTTTNSAPLASQPSRSSGRACDLAVVSSTLADVPPTRGRETDRHDDGTARLTGRAPGHVEAVPGSSRAPMKGLPHGDHFRSPS